MTDIRSHPALRKRPIKQCSDVLKHNAHEWNNQSVVVVHEGAYYCLGLVADEPLSAESVLRDYFANDREGWKRGYGQWAKRARKALGMEVP